MENLRKGKGEPPIFAFGLSEAHLGKDAFNEKETNRRGEIQDIGTVIVQHKEIRMVIFFHPPDDPAKNAMVPGYPACKIAYNLYRYP